MFSQFGKQQADVSVDTKYRPKYNFWVAMRIKLKTEQLNKLGLQLPFEVVLSQSRDVRGFLEILGHNMPWDETGQNRFGDPIKKPSRLAFSVEETNGGYICDIHPALACYISNLLDQNKKPQE